MDQTPLEFDTAPTGPYPARARAGDPDTSHQAAASVTERTITETHRRIMHILNDRGPLTDERIADRYLAQYGLTSPSGLRTRRHELVEMGRVEWTGDTAKLTTGRQGRVWKLSPT